MRTIDGALKEIQAQDSDSAITRYRIRELVISGEVPAKKAGKKWLIDLDELIRYFTKEGVSE